MKPQSGRQACPAKSPFHPSWACFLQQGQLSAENSVGFCSFCFFCVPMWTGEWNRFPHTGRLGWFGMLSSALAWSDIVWRQRCRSPEVRAPCCSVKPAWWLPSNGSSTLPLVSQTSVHSETSHSHTEGTSRSLCTHAGPGLRLRLCGNGYLFLTKNMEQKVRTRDRKMCSSSQDEYSPGWCNTELLSHQAGESDTCFWLVHGSIGASPTAPLGFKKQPRQTAGAGTKCVMGPSNKVSVLIVSIHWFHHLKLALWP